MEWAEGSKLWERVNLDYRNEIEILWKWSNKYIYWKGLFILFKCQTILFISTTYKLWLEQSSKSIWNSFFVFLSSQTYLVSLNSFAGVSGGIRAVNNGVVGTIDGVKHGVTGGISRWEFFGLFPYFLLFMVVLFCGCFCSLLSEYDDGGICLWYPLYPPGSALACHQVLKQWNQLQR